jgi:hypothetical protein
MTQLTPIAGDARSVSNQLTVAVAADAYATLRAVQAVDPFGPAIRAMRALGLAERIALTPNGMSWQPEGAGGRIDVRVDVRVSGQAEDGSTLTVVIRFRATDEATHERLLEAWPVVGPLAATLSKRAARTVKHHAENDDYEDGETTAEVARAA